MIAEKVNFFDFKVEENLDVTIPAHLADPDLQARMKKVLVPPPATKADEIVAVSRRHVLRAGGARAARASSRRACTSRRGSRSTSSRS